MSTSVYLLSQSAPYRWIMRELWFGLVKTQYTVYDFLVMNSSGTKIIYALSDPHDKAHIRYIGCTSQPLDRRLLDHTNKHFNTKRDRWIKTLKSFGRNPVIWELERISEEQSKSVEDWWIRVASQRTGLLNICSKCAHKLPRPQRGKCKLNPNSVREIRSDFNNGMTCMDIAKKWSVNRMTVSQIVKRHAWRHVK